MDLLGKQHALLHKLESINLQNTDAFAEELCSIEQVCSQAQAELVH